MVAEIMCHPVGIKAPSAMSGSKRFHGHLRKNIQKLKETYGESLVRDGLDQSKPRGSPKKPSPDKLYVNREYLLDFAVKWVKSTVGPEGICPYPIVFGAMPKLPLPGSSHAAVPQVGRMRMLETGRGEYITHVAKMRLKQAESASKGFTTPKPRNTVTKSWFIQSLQADGSPESLYPEMKTTFW